MKLREFKMTNLFSVQTAKQNPLNRYGVQWHNMCRWVLRLSVITTMCLLLIGCANGAPTTLVGTPAPWDMQVNAAVQAALKTDPTARLYNITAFPEEYHSSNWNYSSSALHSEFSFDRMSGNDLKVSFNDTSLTTTLTVEVRNISTNDRVSGKPGSPQSASSILAAVKLSPREAGLITWSDAMVQANQRQIEISPLFSCDVLLSNAEWTITYVASTPKLLDGHDLEYVIDAKTGQTLSKDYTPTAP